ncbi:hypothetical protein D3C77_695460 [compost metagenome]
MCLVAAIVELLGEGHAVAQAGQRVAMGQVIELLLEGDLVADVMQDAAQAAVAAAGVADQRDAGLEIADSTVTAADRHDEAWRDPAADGLSELLA